MCKFEIGNEFTDECVIKELSFEPPDPSKQESIRESRRLRQFKELQKSEFSV